MIHCERQRASTPKLWSGDWKPWDCQFDNWWQTETGIAIANSPMEVRPGSMEPLPGVEAAVVEVHDGG
jgi:acyl-coenzyme A synthetase/AMP-(fatty) acid ligase